MRDTDEKTSHSSLPQDEKVNEKRSFSSSSPDYLSFPVLRVSQNVLQRLRAAVVEAYFCGLHGFVEDCKGAVTEQFPCST